MIPFPRCHNMHELVRDVDDNVAQPEDPYPKVAECGERGKEIQVQVEVLIVSIILDRIVRYLTRVTPSVKCFDSV